MAIEFKRVLTPGIAQLSYLVGDSSAGVAAVIDPRPDCETYLQMARELGVAITHIFETHIHADFMSGARELADRLGNAQICASGEGGAEYGFPLETVTGGDSWTFGKLRLTARHTPGHTPEHIAYELANESDPKTPWGVLTGDSLFVGSVGRPDLLGQEQTEDLVKQLFETMQNYFKQLHDGVVIYPCHGHGSECGPNIADRLDSSIGLEKAHNEYLKINDFGEFKERILSAAPPEPTHYKRMKKTNAAGPPVLGAGPTISPLTPERFQAAAQDHGALLLDTRHMLAFGGGHIAGALNIGLQPELTIWSGWMVDPEKELLVVLDDDGNVPAVRDLLVRVGLTKFGGYLAGGMTAWQNAGLPLQRLEQIPVHELEGQTQDVQLIDVRKDEEWAAGHLPDAVHSFVPQLAEHLDRFDPQRRTVTYCASGYRASLAASLLQRNGFQQVQSVPGSWSAWTSAGLPIVNGG
jgi:hydroxyacylglutathione hydrolase